MKNEEIIGEELEFIRFTADIPEDLHADFKSKCARVKVTMGSKLIDLVSAWVEGRIKLDSD